MSLLYPDKEYKSIYDIPFHELYRQGFRGLIIDIDNTVVEHNAPADAASIRLFKDLHDIGFRTCLISNNSEDRVRPLAEAVGSDYISHAGKPKKKAYVRALDIMGTDPSVTIAIGDQVFTDVFGANNYDLTSILLSPIGYDPDTFVRFKRRFERIVLFFYHKHNQT